METIDKVICDECKKMFHIKAKDKSYSKGIVETYFICPNCKKRYTSFYTNGPIRRKQKELRDSYVELNNIIKDNIDSITDIEIDKFQKYQDKLKEVIGIEMEELKEYMQSRRL